MPIARALEAAFGSDETSANASSSALPPNSLVGAAREERKRPASQEEQLRPAVVRKLPLRQGDKRELEDYPGWEDAGPEPDQPDEVMMIELLHEATKWTGTWKAEIN